jgi:hypothetical protein
LLTCRAVFEVSQLAQLSVQISKRSLSKDAPEPREVYPPARGKIVELPEVGGLHHRYERLAA